MGHGLTVPHGHHLSPFALNPRPKKARSAVGVNQLVVLVAQLSILGVIGAGPEVRSPLWTACALARALNAKTRPAPPGRLPDYWQVLPACWCFLGCIPHSVLHHVLCASFNVQYTVVANRAR
jgi:hypothetical protein